MKKLVTIHGMEAAHSNIRGDIPTFAAQKPPLTSESFSHGMRSRTNGIFFTSAG